MRSGGAIAPADDRAGSAGDENPIRVRSRWAVDRAAEPTIRPAWEAGPERLSGEPADIDIAVPVYNEERGLEPSVRRLHRYLEERFPVSAAITIVDNASTDSTWSIATRLSSELPRVTAVHLDEKGRGRALRTVWERSLSPVVAYMDVDLATDLDALLPLVAPILSGHSELATGSRLASGANVKRGLKREVISRCYNILVRVALRGRFSDAQCGFKAVRADVARTLLPLVEDNNWFFDTELLALAQRNNLRVHEVPVDWTDDPDSRVRILATAFEDLMGLWRMARTFARGGGYVDIPSRRVAPVRTSSLNSG